MSQCLELGGGASQHAQHDAILQIILNPSSILTCIEHLLLKNLLLVPSWGSSRHKCRTTPVNNGINQQTSIGAGFLLSKRSCPTVQAPMPWFFSLKKTFPF